MRVFSNEVSPEIMKSRDPWWDHSRNSLSGSEIPATYKGKIPCFSAFPDQFWNFSRLLVLIYGEKKRAKMGFLSLFWFRMSKINYLACKGLSDSEIDTKFHFPGLRTRRPIRAKFQTF